MNQSEVAYAVLDHALRKDGAPEEFNKVKDIEAKLIAAFDAHKVDHETLEGKASDAFKLAATLFVLGISAKLEAEEL